MEIGEWRVEVRYRGIMREMGIRRVESGERRVERGEWREESGERRVDNESTWENGG